MGLFCSRDCSWLEADVLEVANMKFLLAKWASAMGMPPMVDALFAVLVPTRRQNANLKLILADDAFVLEILLLTFSPQIGEISMLCL